MKQQSFSLCEGAAQETARDRGALGDELAPVAAPVRLRHQPPQWLEVAKFLYLLVSSLVLLGFRLSTRF
jgi:hypothetical protein